MEQFARKYMDQVVDAVTRLSNDLAINAEQRQGFREVLKLAKEASRMPDQSATVRANAVVGKLCTACRAIWAAYDPQCEQRYQWFQPCVLVRDHSP